ncbi:hypothetical protein, partial [Hungatella hathewayi]|uniref:hypothetical protein n=1 Tax=Hungatella hathewayi TaxID=154046 RepID=UPI0035624ACE
MIDDLCQSLDELNVASFVEIIKNEFTDTQVILSTYETSYEKSSINWFFPMLVDFRLSSSRSSLLFRSAKL